MSDEVRWDIFESFPWLKIYFHAGETFFPDFVNAPPRSFHQIVVLSFDVVS